METSNLSMTNPITVEEVAKRIYEVMPYDEQGKKPAWVENGNSDRQGQARACAMDIVTALLDQIEESLPRDKAVSEWINENEFSERDIERFVAGAFAMRIKNSRHYSLY